MRNLISFKSRTLVAILSAAGISVMSQLASGAELGAARAAKVEEMIAAIKQWAAAPAIVSAVKARNQNAPAEAASMDQAKWGELSVLDPFIRGLSKCDAAAALKAARTEVVTEMFLNAADGTKVALLAKTSGWSHKGKGKHDVPMKGEVWKGDVEIDESTGLEQIQVAVPVLDGSTPIGSLVVGIGLSGLN